MEIDRLHAYRAQEKWINSAEDFQRWGRFVGYNATRPILNSRGNCQNSNFSRFGSSIDLNAAASEDFKQINGIGIEQTNHCYKTYWRFCLEEQLDEVMA